MDKQGQLGHHIFFSNRPERNLKKLLTKAEVTDFVIDYDERRVNRNKRTLLKTSQPQIVLDQRSEIEEIFSNEEI